MVLLDEVRRECIRLGSRLRPQPGETKAQATRRMQWANEVIRLQADAEGAAPVDCEALAKALAALAAKIEGK
jgi:hypothetical protein